MSFIKEAADALGLDFFKDTFSYQVINFGGNAVYIEGFKSVMHLSETEIILNLKKGKLTVFGSGLKVNSLTRDTVTIKGNIVSVTDGE